MTRIWQMRPIKVAGKFRPSSDVLVRACEARIFVTWFTDANQVNWASCRCLSLLFSMADHDTNSHKVPFERKWYETLSLLKYSWKLEHIKNLASKMEIWSRSMLYTPTPLPCVRPQRHRQFTKLKLCIPCKYVYQMVQQIKNKYIAETSFGKVCFALLVYHAFDVGERKGSLSMSPPCGLQKEDYWTGKV